jgi:hypothetical protein
MNRLYLVPMFLICSGAILFCGLIPLSMELSSVPFGMIEYWKVDKTIHTTGSESPGCHWHGGPIVYYWQSAQQCDANWSEMSDQLHDSIVAGIANGEVGANLIYVLSAYPTRAVIISESEDVNSYYFVVSLDCWKEIPSLNWPMKYFQQIMGIAFMISGISAFMLLRKSRI